MPFIWTPILSDLAFQMEKEVEERLKRGPEVEKRVTQTTSAEGWVQVSCTYFWSYFIS